MKNAVIIALALATTALVSGQAFADNLLLEEAIRQASENGLSSDVIRLLEQSGFGQ